MMLSVIMITYGHEKYIREAIYGVLMQECDFEIELIIANDCSPDKTATIVNDIIEVHPRGKLIKYFRHEKNIGMMLNFLFAYKKCNGKYIAICEGDDYWTDPLKLQKQVDFLENNYDYVLCFHKVNVLKINGEIVNDFITKVPENYENIETLARLGNYIHTPSVVFRNCIEEFPFEFKYASMGDFFIYMMLAEHGKLKCLEDKMCVYRHGVGVFSSSSRLNILKSNLNIFTCLLSYLEDKSIKKIILSRQLMASESLEKFINEQYKDSFVSNHIFFRFLKFILGNYKKPDVIFKKIKNFKF
jgi:glycosyltransferase involved in cell wall biosynthesis